MKTAGGLIRETRIKKSLSKNELGEMTHIKTNFIEAIENSNWASLPELPIVIGFVKSISHFLDIDELTLVALLKREYQPSFSPKKQENQKTKKIGRTFVWGPRLTFLSLALIILTIVLGYLGFQYRKFNLPPKLIINTPIEGAIVTQGKIAIKGKTDPDATVEVESQSVIVEEDGNFTAEIEVQVGIEKIKITAISRSGKVSTISRTIQVQK